MVGVFCGLEQVLLLTEERSVLQGHSVIDYSLFDICHLQVTVSQTSLLVIICEGHFALP